MARKTRRNLAVTFNMTPMIDIIFNLLIFFMLISQFTQLSVEEVILPPARQAEHKEATDTNTVVINVVDPDAPRILIFRKAYDYVQLTDFLKKKKDTIGSGGQLTIILRADEMIPYEEIAKIMLAAGEAGIKSWWITTEIEKENNSGF